MESDLLSQLRSLANSQYELKSEEFIDRAREILFNAAAEILNLENVISEKKTLLSSLEKEKEVLSQRLAVSINEREQLYDRLVEFDLVRNVELLELKKEIENIKSENIQTIKERNRFESKYNELKLGYDEVERENKRLKELFDKINSDLSTKSEGIKRLENDLSSLAGELRLKTDENASLKSELTKLNSRLEEKEKEMLRLINDAPVAEISENDDSAVAVKELEEHKAFLEKKLDETSEEKRALLSSIEDLKKNAAFLKEERDSFESRVKEIEDKTAFFEARIEDAEKADEKNKELSERLEHTAEELITILKERDGLKQALNDAEATISSLRSGAEGLNAVKESLSEKLKYAEKEALDARKKVDEDVEYLKKEISGLNEKVAAETKENSLLKKNLEHLSSMLEKNSLEAKRTAEDKNLNDSKTIELKKELDTALSEKTASEERALKLEEEIAGHKTEIDTLRAKLAETPTPIGAHEGFIAGTEDMRLQKKSLSSGIKWTLTLLLIFCSALFGMAFYKYKFEDRQKTFLNLQKASQLPKESKENIALKQWPEEPRTHRQGIFTITVTSLTPKLIEIWGIPLTLAETTKSSYYLIEIKADEGCIPEEFVKAPSMSFIDEEGKPLKMENAGIKQNVIYKVNACNGENGAVLLRRFASLEKKQNPRGMIIKILKGEAPIIIK